MNKYSWAIAYIGLIVLVNWGFTVVPLIKLPGGDMWPPMSLAVGFVFVTRDFAQRQIGHWVLGAMLIAGILSWFMASPFVAVASVAAFAVSELADWAIYSFTGRTFHQRILTSSVVSTPIDSAVFLYLIGAFSVAGVVAMTASKMIGALLVWWMLRRRAVA